MNKNKIAIIGTAGRDKNDKYDIDDYNRMIEKCKDIIEHQFKLKPENILLVSGGASLSDHLVVDLYNQNYAKAKLYLPALWDQNKKQYVENNARYDTGKISNYHHKKFSKMTGKNSLNEINQAIENGLEIDVSNPGFKNRNSCIAECDYLIAFGFIKDNIPTTPGTLDTWKKSKAKNKIYVSIDELNELNELDELKEIKKFDN